MIRSTDARLARDHHAQLIHEAEARRTARAARSARRIAETDEPTTSRHHARLAAAQPQGALR